MPANSANDFDDEPYFFSSDTKKIFCSPLQRSYETAQLMLGENHFPIETVDALTEINYGEWEGLNKKDVDSTIYRRWLKNPMVFSPPMGETGLAVSARILPFIYTILLENDQNIVVMVGHEFINKIILNSVAGVSFWFYKDIFLQNPGCINIIDFLSIDKAVVHMING
jgi:probable phosphoglycerate mutase